MAARVSTILVIGGSSGIGEAFARYLHGLGKNVIVTGRNQDKLAALTKELNGLQSYRFDITDFKALPSHVSRILEENPQLDSVVINAGIQKCFNLFDPTTVEPTDIQSEIDTNLTAPTLLIRLVAPHLAGLAAKGTKTTLFVTSSSLAYIPLSFYPAYCATKAGIHALTLILRQQLAFAPEQVKNNMNIVEIVPPYTDTGLDKESRELTVAMQGGPDKAFPATPLKDFMEQFVAALEDTEPDGSLKKEIGVGFGEMGVQTWRGAFGKIYDGMGLST